MSSVFTNSSYKRFNKSSQIILGAQDCHFEEKGPLLEIQVYYLIKDYGCKYVIIGHSERRQYHKEDNLDVKKKLKFQ